jgi:hypothetical protein
LLLVFVGFHDAEQGPTGAPPAIRLGRNALTFTAGIVRGEADSEALDGAGEDQETVTHELIRVEPSAEEQAEADAPSERASATG